MGRDLTRALSTKNFVSRLGYLYGEDQIRNQQLRYKQLSETFYGQFGNPRSGLFFFSAPGRTEIGGNHTDHNHGKVLAAAVNLDTVACVEKTDDSCILVKSDGYPLLRIDLSDLSVHPEEEGKTKALIRGTAGAFVERGYKIGGFKAVITSNVLRGSGLSSSAAFEVLIAAILDGLYNGFTVDAKTRAVIAQRVENHWFGKPSGLMDQMASSVGGLVTIDFAEEDAQVKAISFDLHAAGYELCVINTGGNHGDLTADYASIPAEMKKAAAVFGKNYLREVDPAAFEAALPEVRKKAGDRAVLRALHYFDENVRVDEEVAAIEKGDVQAFFDAVNRSGESIWKLLQNVYARPGEEQMALAIELTRRFLNGEGATRVHGGGFAGTIQAFVPRNRLEEYRTYIEKVFGEGTCAVLAIRPEGAVMMPVPEV